MADFDISPCHSFSKQQALGSSLDSTTHCKSVLDFHTCNSSARQRPAHHHCLAPFFVAVAALWLGQGCSTQCTQLSVLGIFADSVLFSSLLAMVRNFNPFPDPKKGKACNVLKKLAGKKSSAWLNTPYQRHKVRRRLPSQRSNKVVSQHHTAQGNGRRDPEDLDRGQIPAVLGRLRICPCCEKRVLGPLAARPQRDSKAHRCNQKACHNLSRLFTFTRSSPWFEVRIRKANHFKFKQPPCFFVSRACHAAPFTSSRTSTTMPSRMVRNLDLVRSSHVVKVEKEIRFGGACFDRKTPALGAVP